MADTLRISIEVRKSKHVNALQQNTQWSVIAGLDSAISRRLETDARSSPGMTVQSEKGNRRPMGSSPWGEAEGWPAAPSAAHGGKRSGDFAKLRDQEGHRAAQQDSRGIMRIILNLDP
jgi:hypothetical protein